MTIEDIKRTDLTQAERDVLKEDGVRWKRMGNAGHLYDWMAYYPGLSIRRRLAMKLAWTNRPEGKGYAQAYNQLMQADGFNTKDANLMRQMRAVLWIGDNPQHEQILREILDAMTPGERSLPLNSSFLNASTRTAVSRPNLMWLPRPHLSRYAPLGASRAGFLFTL